jgi:hypothetical protein
VTGRSGQSFMRGTRPPTRRYVDELCSRSQIATGPSQRFRSVSRQECVVWGAFVTVVCGQVCLHGTKEFSGFGRCGAVTACIEVVNFLRKLDP